MVYIDDVYVKKRVEEKKKQMKRERWKEPIRQSGIRPPLRRRATEGRQSFVIKRLFQSTIYNGLFLLPSRFLFSSSRGQQLLTGQIFRSAAYMTDDVCPLPLSVLNHPRSFCSLSHRGNERKEMGRNSRLCWPIN